jgi:hypothetical protein
LEAVEPRVGSWCPRSRQLALVLFRRSVAFETRHSRLSGNQAGPRRGLTGGDSTQALAPIDSAAEPLAPSTHDALPCPGPSSPRRSSRMPSRCFARARRERADRPSARHTWPDIAIIGSATRSARVRIDRSWTSCLVRAESNVTMRFAFDNEPSEPSRSSRMPRGRAGSRDGRDGVWRDRSSRGFGARPAISNAITRRLPVKPTPDLSSRRDSSPTDRILPVSGPNPSRHRCWRGGETTPRSVLRPPSRGWHRRTGSRSPSCS